MTAYNDIASQTITSHALAQTDATAGGAGDATEIVGTTLNLSSLATRPRSVEFIVPVEATLAEGETLTVTGDIDSSADGSTWSVEVASATLLTLTGDTGGSTEKGVAKVGCNLIQAGVGYVRVNITPTHSAADTDTSKTGGGVAVFGGLDETPN